jgi:hypothetical protein
MEISGNQIESFSGCPILGAIPPTNLPSGVGPEPGSRVTCGACQAEAMGIIVL